MRVTVGVSGGIAAYKAAEVVRALQKLGCDVHVVMTEAACRFIQPLTFAALTGHPVITSLWDEPEGAREANSSEEMAGMISGATSAASPRSPRARDLHPIDKDLLPGTPDRGHPSHPSSIEHIGEAQWAEALVVAPATANVLAKFAHGIADDFLTTMYLATEAQVLVAPAMNVNMWEHAATRANVETLRLRGVRVVEPGTGELACGMVGTGRMAEPEWIAEAVVEALGRKHDLAGEVVLVTAGGTREALDPVRFLGNRSSGKMGYALAEAAQSRGARVVVVSGPATAHPPAKCDLVRVTTAEEMRAAVLERLAEATLVIKAAAVADYRPVTVAEQKLKRTGPMTLELAPTEDILAEVAGRRRPGQLIIGFAAETESLMENARAKLLKKGADAIVVNDVAGEGVGIDADDNAAAFLTATKAIELPRMAKRKLADRILDEVMALRRPKNLVMEMEGTGPAQGSKQDEVLKSSLNAAVRSREQGTGSRDR